MQNGLQAKKSFWKSRHCNFVCAAAVGVLAWMSGPAVHAQEASQAKPAETPIFAIIHVDVGGRYADRCAALLRAYGADSLHERGAIRFDVLRQLGAPNHFTLVEEWADKSAYDAHVGSAHARQFRDRLQPWLGSPFDERLHSLLK
jgi:quinol monooxygenase YgiN